MSWVAILIGIVAVLAVFALTRWLLVGGRRRTPGRAVPTPRGPGPQPEERPGERATPEP